MRSWTLTQWRYLRIWSGLRTPSNSLSSETSFNAEYGCSHGDCSTQMWSHHSFDLHWLPVSQRVIFKTALLVCKCVHGVAPTYLSDLCIPARATCKVVASPPGSMCPNNDWTAKLRHQRTDHVEKSTTCTTCTRSVTEHHKTCAEDTPFSTVRRRWGVSWFRRIYKCTDLLTCNAMSHASKYIMQLLCNSAKTAQL